MHRKETPFSYLWGSGERFFHSLFLKTFKRNAFLSRTLRFLVAFIFIINQVLIPLPLSINLNPIPIPEAFAAVCGDGLIEEDEECDDGNTRNADGCSDICEVDPGFECTGEPSVCAWIPPIGIPAPEFGIVETHYMYEGQTFDYTQGGTIPDPRGVAPYEDVGNGPYTHYIDGPQSINPSCDDNNNPYGTEASPRCSLPRTFSPPAGSVAEIHGGPYEYGNWRQWIPVGTAEQPVFIRGWDPENRVTILQNTYRLGGQYTIIENLEFYMGATPKVKYNSPSHVALRNLEVHDPVGSTLSGTSAVPVQGDDIVIYNNHIHHKIQLYPDGSRIEDAMGVYVQSGSQRTWVVDNHIHDMSGDAVHACHHCDPPPRFIYIGRNVMHDDWENAIDIKNSEDVIISQNVMYGYKVFRSDGTPMVVNNRYDYPKQRTWIIFNEIYDSANAIRAQDSAYIIGNTIYNIHHDRQISDYNPGKMFAGGSGILSFTFSDLTVVGNTIYDVDSGINYAVINPNPGNMLRAHDNIIADLAEPSRHIGILNGEIAAVSEVSHNVLYEPGGSAVIRWGGGGDQYNCDTAPQNEGCIDADPLFVMGKVLRFTTNSPLKAGQETRE